jgi:hypothetical protein
MNKEHEGSLLENNPFIDGLFEWVDSPRGQLSDEVREAAWQRLEKVDVDATNRTLIWEDGRRLSIDEFVQRIRGDYPDFPVELIETHLIAWLEIEFAPQDLFPRAIGRVGPADREVGQRPLQTTSDCVKIAENSVLSRLSR